MHKGVKESSDDDEDGDEETDDEDDDFGRARFALGFDPLVDYGDFALVSSLSVSVYDHSVITTHCTRTTESRLSSW